MFIASQPDGYKNLICYKKLIAAENLKDLLEGLSCNKSCQGSKKTDPALSNCCLSLCFPTAVPRPYLTHTQGKQVPNEQIHNQHRACINQHQAALSPLHSIVSQQGSSSIAPKEGEISARRSRWLAETGLLSNYC